MILVQVVRHSFWLVVAKLDLLGIGIENGHVLTHQHKQTSQEYYVYTGIR
jgi:hypothetical protein